MSRMSKIITTVAVVAVCVMTNNAVSHYKHLAYTQQSLSASQQLEAYKPTVASNFAGGAAVVDAAIADAKPASIQIADAKPASIQDPFAHIAMARKWAWCKLTRYGEVVWSDKCGK